jgi:hypothetical protein
MDPKQFLSALLSLRELEICNFCMFSNPEYEKCLRGERVFLALSTILPMKHRFKYGTGFLV